VPHRDAAAEGELGVDTAPAVDAARLLVDLGDQIGQPGVPDRTFGRARLSRAPDLIGRDFGTDRLNHKWYGDGTEIPTDEGKLYLDSVLGMGSRRIVGFAIGEHHHADLAQAALQMAVAVRGGKYALSEVRVLTDQGSEYTAKHFQAACGRVGIKQSMGRAGSALDNAVIESWHSTVEFELRQLEHFETRGQARRRVAVWIEEYNHHRRHSSLGMLSPAAYELQLLQQSGDEPEAAA
jgi:transposase InsO family protein